MLNYRLLNTLLRSRSINTLVILTSVLGLVSLLDFVLLLQCARLIGPWLTLSLLSFTSALAFYLVHFTVYKRYRKILQCVREGNFRNDLFPCYLCSLLSTLFLVFPGILNKVTGIILLSHFSSNHTGRYLTQLIGVNWEEAYEILKMNYLTMREKKNESEGHDESGKPQAP